MAQDAAIFKLFSNQSVFFGFFMRRRLTVAA